MRSGTWDPGGRRKNCAFISLDPTRYPFEPLLRHETPFDDQLNVIGATRTPFAVSHHGRAFMWLCGGVEYLTLPQVMSGGHTANPGFSSTTGIHIYTGKFSQVTYDAKSGTAVIGTGLIWENVYQRLLDYNVTAVGGRVTGVSEPYDRFCPSHSVIQQIGVGGLTLGGGWSPKVFRRFVH